MNETHEVGGRELGRNTKRIYLEVKSMRSNSKVKSKERPAAVSAPGNDALDQKKHAANYERGDQLPGPKDEWLLKYEVNDKGVGRILLPPSLSILLQSDRVFITPSAGGIFIRSI